MNGDNKDQSRNMYHFDFKTDTGFGEIKSGLSSLRALRDVLVRLVKGLVQWQHLTAYLVLINPRVTVASLENELWDFKEAMRPGIAERLHLILVRDREIESIPADISSSDLVILKQQIESSAVFQSPLPRPDRQSEVLRVILYRWFLGQGPMTLDSIAKAVGCTYRTVAVMIEKLGPAIERLEDRRITLKYFPKETWAWFIAVSRSVRATVDYIDQSNQPRSPESLVRRLQKLNRADIAIGGVMGAKYYYPELNIVSTPRLDLCIHAHGKFADLEFMELLDPSLTRTDIPDVRARVALHFVRRRESLFKHTDPRSVWADPVECLADLFEAKLDPQALEFQAYLSKQGEMLSGRY